jgi:hypothetical protein
MAIEAVFGSGLGDLRRSPESTVLAHRSREEPPETSLLAWGRGLCDLLTGLATSTSDFTLAKDGASFYFLLIVSKPTLHLDLPQTVTFTLNRTRRVSVREQMATAAAQIACRLADLGTPRWLENAPQRGPRQHARLDPLDLL